MTGQQPVFSIQAEDAATAHLIESNLLTSLRSDLPQASNEAMVLAIRDAEQVLIAGLTASASYGWLLIKCLWVAPSVRGKGLGRALMCEGHARAMKMGCHAAWLDTSNPKAQEFYASLGYETFGLLSNEASQYPPTHHRWFMKILLNPTDAAPLRNT